MRREEAQAQITEYLAPSIRSAFGSLAPALIEYARELLDGLSDTALRELSTPAFFDYISRSVDERAKKGHSEYIWQFDCLNAEMSLYMAHRLISEAKARTKAESLTVMCQPRHMDKLRMQLLSFPVENYESSEFVNPLLRATWVESLDIPADEVRLELPEGVCRLYGLCAAY